MCKWQSLWENSLKSLKGRWIFHLTEQFKEFKGKMDISICPFYNPLDGELTLRIELLRDPVPVWSWMLQEVPAQI